MSVLTVTKDNFQSEVMESDKPVLIDFWASWCNPCKALAPVIEQVASEVDNAKICKVNINEQPELSSAFNVMQIPTLVVVKEGKVEKVTVGASSKEEILELLGV